jgi:exopolysaccharide production protein ExoZ
VLLYLLDYEVDEDLPRHSTINRTCQLYTTAVFEYLFDQVFAQCVAAGLTSFETYSARLLMKNRIVSIQLMRALACLLVLMVHLNTFNGLTVNQLSGSVGVDIFFIISGFIIAASVERLPTQHTTKIFLINRVSRVAPYYYLLTFLYLGLTYFTNHYFPTWQAVVKSLLFLPQGHDPVQPAGWTLQHEMFFYCFVAAALFLTRNIKRIAVSFLLMLLVMQVVPARFELVREIKASINVEFFFGMLIYLYREKIEPHFRHLAWLAAAFILLALVMCISIEVPVTVQMKLVEPVGAYYRDTLFFHRLPFTLPRGIGWGLPCALLFVAILAQEHRLEQLDPQNLGLRIGSASFTIYLLQQSFFIFFSHVATLLVLAATGILVIAISLQVSKLESIVASSTKKILKWAL